MVSLVWLACLASSLTGEQVSLSTFNTADCIPATVPSTTFNTLLLNNKFNFTDPFFSENLYNAPDINQTGREYYTYYWRTEIITNDLTNDDIVWLRLRGINYRARVYVDGAIIKEDTTQSTEVEGMYRRFNYILPRSSSISSSLKHTIAILVEPPDFPGSCRVHGGQGGSHGLAKSTTMQFSAGWDWIRGTPDRNTGLWDKVTIETTSSISFRHSFVKVSNIVTTPTTFALLTPSTTLIVRDSTTSTIKGTLTCHITTKNDPSTIIISSFKNLSIVNNDTTKDLDVIVQLPTISFNAPNLWYPKTHGIPFLYMASFVFTPATDNNSNTNTTRNSTLSSASSISFGIKKTETYIDATTEGRGFKINDIPIFLQGGNWIHTDQFLRYSSDQARYYNEVQMHVEMGMNIIRVWGGGLTERPEFYNAADELGILVMQEFWMSGDNNGRWAGKYSWPIDHTVYLDNAKDMILMVRNHPSLLFWCGGNELYPVHKSPPPDIAADLPSLIAQYDPGRFYIASSMSNYTNYDPSFALAPKDGPYGILLPSDFYVRNPGLTFWNGTRADQLKLSFQPEIGSVSTPSLESLQRFISQEDLLKFPGYATNTETDIDTDATTVSMGSSWTFHNYIGFITPNTTWHPELKKPFNHIHNMFGGQPPANVSEYAVAGSIIQMQQYQCLFEGFQQYMWQYYTAVLMWKSQSPWPVLRGAFYDNYLAMTGGYWGVKRALTGNVHVQLNLLTWEPTLLNKGQQDYIGTGNVLDVYIELYTMHGKLVKTYQRSAIDGKVAAQEVMVFEKISWPTIKLKGNETLLIRMSAKNGKKQIVSNNFYWSSDPTVAVQQHDELAMLRKDVAQWVNVNVVVSKVTTTSTSFTLRVDKDAKAVAMFVQLDLIHGDSNGVDNEDNEDRRILPVFFSDNLFCLLPGEEKTVTVTTSNVKILNGSLRLSGWNVHEKIQILQD